ncbi:DUF4394 domain-containing protein [Limnobacter sp.]|uniref:DUF4394 domain-containing protein n=1 Tax=Limnobacter sp. TaxID=2003368 RepID=UPI00374A438C
MIFKKKFVALALSSLVLGGCFSDDDNLNLSAGDVFLLTDANQLASLNRDNPSQLRTSTQLSGFMSSGEVAIGMDFRPFNSKLYVVTKDASDVGRAYTVNTSTGELTFIATLVADPADDSPGNAAYATLLGDNFGVDFNPAADALRVVSDAGQNLRIFLDNDRRATKTAGQTITDLEINGGPANAETTGAAYTNSFDGTSGTRLFDIDTVNSRLVLQSANPGTLTDIAPLGVSATAVNGFDIDPETNVGYALLTVGASKGLYTVRIPDPAETLPIATNAAALLGNVNISGNVIGLALELNKNPTVVGLNGTLTAPTLFSFTLRTPNTISTPIAVTGLAAGDQLLGIDVRPATGELYGFVRNGTNGKLYTINPDTGASTLKSSLSNANTAGAALAFDAAKVYSIDFNPAADRLRLVSSGNGDGENYRINVDTGATIVERDQTAAPGGDPAGGDLRSDAGAPTPAAVDFSVTQIAYTRNFSSTIRPAPSTRMFDIDSVNSTLLQQLPPNTGLLRQIGAVGGGGLNNFAGFDVVGGDDGARVIAGRIGTTGPYSLFDINLSTGAAMPAGALIGAGATNQIGGGTGPADLRDLAIIYNQQ